MNKENSKLGRGLSSLFSPTNKDGNDTSGDKIFKLINISSITSNSQQPRKNFTKDEIIYI